MDEKDADIAIAIKYDKQNDQAPRVVAKGLHFKAEKIRELAKEYGVPVMRNVPLANALYRIDIGEEVPEELYDAVAEVLNFVYALQQGSSPKEQAEKSPK